MRRRASREGITGEGQRERWVRRRTRCRRRKANEVRSMKKEEAREGGWRRRNNVAKQGGMKRPRSKEGVQYGPGAGRRYTGQSS
jgi:hypothetical protein